MLDYENNNLYKQIYMSKLKIFGGKLFFESNYSEHDVDKTIQSNDFFKDLLKAWCKCNYKTKLIHKVIGTK